MKNIWFKESDKILRESFKIDSLDKIAARINTFLIRHYKQIGRKKLMDATPGGIMFRALKLNLITENEYNEFLQDRKKEQTKIRNTIGKISNADRNSVIARDKVCLKCGSAKDLTIDHKKPVRFGGTGNYTNLQLLCRSCNSRKGLRENT